MARKRETHKPNNNQKITYYLTQQSHFLSYINPGYFRYFIW